jgi:4-amino-4-deoxy-L-arabinose transferase-like glycosyltransferase
METKHFSKTDGIILGLILMLGLALRLYRIDAPLTDFHSWRQADTAAVARNFVRGGFNLLRPTYDDLSSIQSGRENPNGLRYVEFPLYNAMFAALFKIAPVMRVEMWGRAVTILFSLITAAVMYYLLLKEGGRTAAIAGSFLYSILPSSVFFSRVVLPETTALGFVFLSLFFLYRWRHGTGAKLWLPFALSVVCFAAAVLVKPTVIFYGLPLLYLIVARYGFAFLRKPGFYLYFIISLLPLVLWRYYILRFPEGIPSSDWLITSVNTFEGQRQIFMKPAFFRWIFYERINVMIFGGLLTGFFIYGAFARMKNLFLHSVLASAFAYVFVFQGGNVQHEYYQTVIIAPLAMFAGIGIALLFHERKRFLSPLFTVPAILFAIALSVSFSWYYRVKDFYTYPEDLNHMARILNAFTDKEDKIITDRLGDTTLLYLADRKGAPMLYKTLEQLKSDGYSYYMTDKQEIIGELKEKGEYGLLFENKQFALFKL